MPPDSHPAQGLLPFDASLVSDALERLGIQAAAHGIRRLSGAPRLIGRVVTVQLAAQARPPTGHHINTAAIDAARRGDVLVVGNHGSSEVACWGELLSIAAIHRGLAGVILDGVVRDIDAIVELGFTVHARGTTVVTARGKLVEVGTGLPVKVAGITVNTGDFVVADGSGAVFVPQDTVSEVIAAAALLKRHQDAIVAEIRSGRRIAEAFRDDEPLPHA